MRLLPAALAALAWTPTRARSTCQQVTHHSLVRRRLPDADRHAAHALLAGADKKTVLQQHVQPLINNTRCLAFAPAAAVTAAMSWTPDVVSGVFDTDTLEDCLIDVVNRGGDADTTGAIAGMLAGTETPRRSRAAGYPCWTPTPAPPASCNPGHLLPAVWLIATTLVVDF
ncbi:MAG: ADP-ribosylglycohydrolase family protein [Rivihabitans pingtungensis]